MSTKLPLTTRNKSHVPRFSLLMCVCPNDDHDHFFTALNSVTHDQTLPPSEAVIVIDGDVGSEVHAIIKSVLAASSIPSQIVQNKTQRGLAFSLNRGLACCRFDWAARMDADDISLPNRFLEQMSFLAANQGLSVLGSSVIEFGNVRRDRVKVAITEKAEISKALRVRNPINHPTCIINVHHALSVGGYPGLAKNQDYALWISLISKGYEIANIAPVLLKFRVTHDFFSKRGLRLLKHDYAILRLLLSNGMISPMIFICLALSRTILRLLPEKILRMVYGLSR